MQSMTGYGSYAQDTGSHQVSMRIRSVNHRYLDLVLRMPEDFRSLELEVRERIGNRLNRGRIELRLDIEDRRDRPVTVEVNKSWISAFLQAQKELAEAHLDLAKFRLGDLLRFPDAVRISATTSEVDAESSASIFAVLEEALDDLESSRVKEGTKLKSVLEAQMASLADLVEQISAAQETIRRDQEERLRSRIQDLVGDSEIVDERRIEQEIAFLAERSDVREELDRLVTHMGHFLDTIAQTGAIGKKLDFITQEISRELTTLGAKCRQAGVMQRNVEAKLICEQIREQIQNIE